MNDAVLLKGLAPTDILQIADHGGERRSRRFRRLHHKVRDHVHTLRSADVLSPVQRAKRAREIA